MNYVVLVEGIVFNQYISTNYHENRVNLSINFRTCGFPFNCMFLCIYINGYRAGKHFVKKLARCIF